MSLTVRPGISREHGGDRRDRHALCDYRWSAGRGGIGYAQRQGLSSSVLRCQSSDCICLAIKDIAEGWRIVTTAHPEKLSAIGSATDPTPFLTLFTGMLFANLSYWGTNQYVIQRSLAAESLAAGQKGVLLAGFFKLLIPFFVMLPGIIAFHLYGPDIGGMDKAYPRLVRDVLPSYLIGLFLAVLLGTVFSSFNSLLQSSATIITYDIVMPWRGKPLSDRAKINVGRWACLAVSLVGLIVAPSLQLAPEGLWQLIRKFSGFYNIPLIAIVLAALFLPREPPARPLWVVLFHIPVYTVITFCLGLWYPLHTLVRHFVCVGIRRVGALRKPTRPDHTNHQLTGGSHALALSLVGRWLPMALHHRSVCTAVTDRYSGLTVAKHRLITISQHIFLHLTHSVAR